MEEDGDSVSVNRRGRLHRQAPPWKPRYRGKCFGEGCCGRDQGAPHGAKAQNRVRSNVQVLEC